MKGEVLHYDDNQGTGQISGADGIRYNFTRADLKQLIPISKGTLVDFDFEGKQAKDIYVIQPTTAPPGGPQRYTGPVEPERGLFEYFTRAFSVNYANFNGRARRKEYWGFVLFYLIIYLILGAILAVGYTANPQNPTVNPAFWIGAILLVLYSLASIIPSLALLVRRLHDIGQTGWIALVLAVLGAIPYVSIFVAIAVIVIACIDSQPFENKYGPPPKRVA